MIYELVDSSDEEMYYSLGFWTDKEEALKALDSCNEPADLGSPVEAEDTGVFELREHKDGWECGFHTVVK